MGKVQQTEVERITQRAEAIADLITRDQIKRLDGARQILVATDEFLNELKAGGKAAPGDVGKLTYALATGLQAALLELEKKGPVMVRYLDGDALVTMLMPNGPPKGFGG